MCHVALTAASIASTIEGFGNQGISGIVALLPEAEKERVGDLQAGCRLAGMQLVGAIFPALIKDDHFLSEGAWLLGFHQMPPHFLTSCAKVDSEASALRIAEGIRAFLPDAGQLNHRPTLFLCFDAMLPNIASILDGVYLQLANRVGYAGVNAGSETFQPMPCLFDETAMMGDGVLALLLPEALQPLLAHGFVPPERAMSATSTDGNRIVMIDWRPAFEVYQELIRVQFGIALSRENFYEYAVHFPFGVIRANGEVVVRIPVALADDNSLFCVGEIPENSMLALLEAPASGAGLTSLSDQLKACQRLHEGQLLTFYCAGRRMHLGAAAEQELSALRDATAVSGMGGALSLGEIGSTVRKGYPMFHNATVVSVPWLSP